MHFPFVMLEETAGLAAEAETAAADLIATAAGNDAAAEPSNLFVVVFGILTVFVGLICIIAIIELMTAICRKFEKPAKAEPAKAAPAAAAPAAIENRGEIVAAVCAAVAEELGTDISALRVISFKKL